jgi:hypothetical protein
MISAPPARTLKLTLARKRHHLGLVLTDWVIGLRCLSRDPADGSRRSADKAP